MRWDEERESSHHPTGARQERAELDRFRNPADPTGTDRSGPAAEAEGIDRREFLRRAGTCALAAVGLGAALELIPQVAVAGRPKALSPLRMKRAMWWKPIGRKRVECHLCPKHCQVGDRERGYCGVRENRDGVYYTLVYGSAAAANPDPIEKKPFFHFLPGTMAFSIATAGCNMNCKDCQNWELSQSRPEQVPSLHLPPAEVVRQAIRTGCKSIAYTYNEPVIFYEYMHDTAVEARKRGVRSVVVSNGYIEQEPLLHLLPKIDAFKVDLKGFSDAFYKRYCNGTLGPVLETIKTVKRRGVWLEIVYLVVPTINDDPKMIEATCKWVLRNVGPDVPMHFSRFYPHYQLRNLPPTPYSTLERCYKIARKVGLHFVYLGNIRQGPEMNTYCPGCGKLLIERVGFWVTKMRIKNGRCPYCGRKIPGVWS